MENFIAWIVNRDKLDICNVYYSFSMWDDWKICLYKTNRFSTTWNVSNKDFLLLAIDSYSHHTLSVQNLPKVTLIHIIINNNVRKNIQSTIYLKFTTYMISIGKFRCMRKTNVLWKSSQDSVYKSLLNRVEHLMNSSRKFQMIKFCKETKISLWGVVFFSFHKRVKIDPTTNKVNYKQLDTPA